jgi:hypothetical protein
MSDDEGSQRRSEILYPRESTAVENSPRVSSLNETKSRLAVDETSWPNCEKRKTGSKRRSSGREGILAQIHGGNMGLTWERVKGTGNSALPGQSKSKVKIEWRGGELKANRHRWQMEGAFQRIQGREGKRETWCATSLIYGFWGRRRCPLAGSRFKTDCLVNIES